AFWDSADDPNIRLIVVSPNRAEFWDGPNSLTAAVKMMFASVTGSKPDLGDNRETGM
ncbi:pyridoxamine 5'-phosphate oxidase family protein, partial [Pseudochrobactrum asaccharolyticum]